MRYSLHRIGIAMGLGAALAMAQAQDGWVRQSPLPVDRSAKSVFAIDAQRAYFAGENGLLMQTKDAGATWTIHQLLDWGTDPYYMVHFLNPSTGLVAGNNQLIRSTDGGLGWTPTSSYAGSWSHFDFVDANNGFAGANGACVATSNGGQTWSLRSGYPDCPVMFGMDFRDVNVGLVGGVIAGSGSDGIFKTSDGGRTWSLKAAVGANDVVWMSNTRAIADEGMTIRESLDSGETWHTIYLGLTTGLVSMTRAGTGNLVLGVSGKGDVWRSTDGGRTWVQTFDGPGALPEIWEISFSDELHGWIVGPGSFFYYSDDGGQTWQQKNTGTATQVFDIHMLDDSFGMAVGHNGYIYRTTDGGAFWEIQKLEVTGQIWGRDEDLVAIDVVDRQFAAAAGPGGTVFKTEDGGLNWQSIGYPNLYGYYWIYDIDFIDHQLGYVYGVNPDFDTKFLFRTRNGGASWEWVDMGNIGGGTTAQFIDADYGWLTADNAFGWRTTNGGLNWTSFNMPTYFSGPEVSKVRFLDRNRGWVVGWDGYVGKTIDGGQNWTLIDLGTIEDHLFDVLPVSASEIWMCGRESASFAGVIYHSTNGGQTWSRQVVTNWFYYPYRITALPSGNVWFAGYAGAIFRRDTAQTVLPGSLSIQPGVHVSGGLPQITQSDDTYLVMGPQYNISRQQDPITLQLDGIAPSATPIGFEFALESRVNSDVQLKIDLWNFAQSTWETVHTSTATMTDSTVTGVASGALSRFVQTGTRQIRARVRWKPAANAARSWNAFVDLAVWRIRP